MERVISLTLLWGLAFTGTKEFAALLLVLKKDTMQCILRHRLVAAGLEDIIY